VLPGGGALGASQVGMLRALCEVGVVPDLVVGTSVGALNAVVFATEPTLAGIDRLAALWCRLRRRDIAGVRVRQLVRAVAGTADGLLSAEPLANLFSDYVAARLDDTVIPAHVVATDVESGAAVVLSSGHTQRALLASAAFPGLYPSVVVEGTRLVDGGIAADVPIRQAEALGADVCYVLPAAVGTDAQHRGRGPVAMVHRSVAQILDTASRREIEKASGRVYVLPTAFSSTSNIFDFRHSGRLIEDGHRLARRWLTDAEYVTTVPAAMSA
jgi:NTE family protein